MADNYGDLFELGITGVDRVVDKYYDAAYAYANKKARWKKKRDKQAGRSSRQGSQPPPEEDNFGRSPVDWDKPSQPPVYTGSNNPPLEGPGGYYPAPPGDPDRYLGEEGWNDSRDMYTQDRRTQEEWRGYEYDARDGPYYGSGSSQRSNYAAADAGVVAVRGREEYQGGYEVAPRAAPMPPPPFGHAERRYDGGYDEDGWRREGGRPGPHRRPSSYSPRRSDRHDSTPRRVRSKSPNHHRVAATVVGALAGGLVGNAAKKGHDGLFPTVAGAVVGGLGARELEKLYDRHEDKKAEAEARRERRRREREREWEREYEWR